MHPPRSLTLALGCLLAAFSNAQTPQPAAPVANPNPPTVASNPIAQPPQAPAAAAKPNDKLPVRERERTVYVPYEELEKVFQDGGRGVFLPYREFLELWNELTLKREQEDKAPADGVVSRAEYTGRVEGKTLVLDAKIAVESFQKGWITLPLGGSDMAGIGEAQTGKAVLHADQDGAKILLPEKGVYELSLKLFAPVTESSGKSKVKLVLPKAAVSKLTASIPGDGLEFEVTPAAAFTSRAAAPGQTELSFFFGGGASHEISWGGPQAVTQLTPLLLADTKVDAAIGSGSIATTAAVSFRIMRAPVSAFRISVPASHEVLGVSGDDVKEWNIEAAGERKTIVVTPNKPAKDKYSLTLSLESPIAKLPAEVPLPDLVIEGASYARGTASVQTEPQFDAAPKALDGVVRANAAANAAADGMLFAGSFRLLKQPWKLSLDVTEAKPQVEVGSLTKLDVQRDALKIDAAFDFNVRRVGIFEARIGLPAGLNIGTVTGDGIGEWNVETIAAAGNAPALQTLVVKLPQQKTGAFKISLAARQLRAQPADDLTVPVFAPQGASRHEAKTGIAVHSSLEVNTKDIGGFQQEDVSAIPSLTKGGSETTLAFRYRDAAKPAVLSFKSRDPQVSAEVLTLVEAREQSTRHTWTLDFDVAYAAVDRFVLALPKAIAGEARLVDPQVKEIKKDHQPDPAKIKNADTAANAYWEVILRNEKLGAFQLTLSHEKQGALEAGKTGQVELLQAHVPAAFQETGQIAVLKDDSLEIRSSKPENLEEIDSRELHPAVQRPGVFLAFKYRSLPVKLAVEVAKNAYFKVPQAVVTHADLVTAVSTDRAQSTEVVYWVKNIDLQFLVVSLPAGAKLVSDIVVGRESQQPMKREGSEDLLVRLPSGSGSSHAAFPVRFVYHLESPKPGEQLPSFGSLTVDPPSVGDVKVFETRHRLFLPEKFDYTGFSGPLTQTLPDRGWMRIRRLIDPLIPAFGPQASRTNDFQWNDPPPVASEVKSLYDFQVPQQGHPETLRRLGAPAKIGVSFRSRKITFAAEAAAFIITLLIGVFCCRCSMGCRLFYVVVFGCGPVLLTGLLSAANSRIACSMILAVGVAIGIWILIGALGIFGAVFRRGGKPRQPPSTPPAAAQATTAPATAAPGSAPSGGAARSMAAAKSAAAPPPASSSAPAPTHPSAPPDKLEFPDVSDDNKKAE